MISGAMKANTEALLDAFIHIRYIYGHVPAEMALAEQD